MGKRQVSRVGHLALNCVLVACTDGTLHGLPPPLGPPALRGAQPQHQHQQQPAGQQLVPICLAQSDTAASGDRRSSRSNTCQRLHHRPLADPPAPPRPPLRSPPHKHTRPDRCRNRHRGRGCVFPVRQAVLTNQGPTADVNDRGAQSGQAGGCGGGGVLSLQY